MYVWDFPKENGAEDAVGHLSRGQVKDDGTDDSLGLECIGATSVRCRSEQVWSVRVARSMEPCQSPRMRLYYVMKRVSS